MSANHTHKVAFIGTHGVGKTTLCFGLAARLKARDLSLEVVHEVARRCPLPINEETSLEAQAWILHTQVAEELVAQSRYRLVVCDRSVVDNYAYLQIAHGNVGWLDRLVRDWTRTYAQLFLVPLIAPPQPDGTRAMSPDFQREVDTRLRYELARRGIQFVDLGAHPRERWLDEAEEAVLEALRPPQLELI